MKATRYNAARAGSLWLLAELPIRLSGAGAPGSQGFADEVASIQTELGLDPDGKLGPTTWDSLRAHVDASSFEFDPEEAITGELRDVRVDSDDEAILRLANGFRFSPHLGELGSDFVAALRGRVDPYAARRIYRAMRRDGQMMTADILRKGGRDAEDAYAYKGRTAEQMRKGYSRRWHKYIQDDRRLGMGTHWTGGTGSAYAAARYLLSTCPGRVSSNAFIDYDGSTLITFPTLIDEDLGDPELLFTSHGAHNPACFGVDFTSPGFLTRKGSRWTSRAGSKVSDSVVAACGVVTLDELDLRSWPASSPDVPWLNRKTAGRVWSVESFLAPTWEQLASYIVLGRVHAAIYSWTEADPVVVGHHQRSDSRADPFHYPLRWCREAILSDVDLLAPGSWLSLINPEEVGELLVQYRRDVAGSGW